MALNTRLRVAIPVVALIALVAILVRFHESIANVDSLFSLPHHAKPAHDEHSSSTPPPSQADPNQNPKANPKPLAEQTPIYKPAPTYTPPPVVDPFPLLTNTDAPPPPIPAHNVPRPDLHKTYGLDRPPPLFIGFTRQWPILLQCIVSYITAGWPASGIYVLENTGVQVANARGNLTLQNPFYLNHTTLRRLGVNVLQAPALLSFSQMQNMFLHEAHAHGWPQYFYSHQDVLVYSFEDGADDRHRPGDRKWDFYDDADREEGMRPAAAGRPGYRTIYENCLRDLNATLARGERWGFRWYQYDHLTLVNRDAMDAIGGWDSLIPYYATDCDMNARLTMDGWTMKHRRAGLINDVSTHLEDLAVLYRVPGAEAKFVDPNPPPPEKRSDDKTANGGLGGQEAKPSSPDTNTTDTTTTADAANYFRAIVDVGLDMTNYKYRDSDHNRNSWQKSQHGGAGEPYYYNPEGFAEAFEVLVAAGRKIFELKWGRGGCDIAEGFGLKVEDQWRVMPANKKDG
ncbi:glycosyl transferase family 8 protein [Colletotrichum incanum]|nr:glycosyl transferase family 8 protein [Colletotrichum incanum]